ncbi:1-deoxy-D-xylulose-5-phosphate synthase [Chlamydiota bacterium]
MKNLLTTVNSPIDIKNFSEEELKLLAKELRERIIDVVSLRGGHLSSSLGVVELTLALHYVFNSPKDKIIWDVGHQTYAHKLITGRRDIFKTLRQFGGMSGFPKPEESKHDVFISGHSSTSISVGLGMATARDLLSQDERIIAVIGDGALSGGMAFEALNNAGLSGRDLLVIVNANDMSISRSTGAIAKYLNKIITNPFYNRLKNDLELLIEKIPKIGPFMLETAHKMEEGVKGLFVPGLLFEEMGFRYFGPIDGHDIMLLITVLRSLLRVKGPLLLHVNTKKGKGYMPAEDSPDIFHSSPRFDKKTGVIADLSSKKDSYTTVFSEILVARAQTDDRIIAVTAAMMHGTGLEAFAEKFPDRFFDVGIAEQHAVTFAGGAAAKGLRPVVAIYSSFLQRAIDQIIHDICIEGHPVIFAIDRAGIVGEDGQTHHGVFDVSLLRAIPNLVILQPASKEEMWTMFDSAFDCNGPVAIRYPKGTISFVESVDYKKLGIGRARYIKEGSDILILALGHLLTTAVDVADLLENDGISCAIIDPRSIKPLDEQLLLQAVASFRRCYVLEDHVICGGFGSALLELLAREQISNVDVQIRGWPDCFIEHGDKEALLTAYSLTTESLYNEIKKKMIDRIRKEVVYSD